MICVDMCVARDGSFELEKLVLVFPTHLAGPNVSLGRRPLTAETVAALHKRIQELESQSQASQHRVGLVHRLHESDHSLSIEKHTSNHSKSSRDCHVGPTAGYNTHCTGADDAITE